MIYFRQGCILNSGKSFINKIVVSKHGIHDIILELIYKFKFDQLLPSGCLLIPLAAYCIGLIVFHNPTATYIADRLLWVSHDALTRLLPMISTNNNNIVILFIQGIQSYTAKLGYLIIDDVIIRKPFGKTIAPTSYVYDHTNHTFVWGMHIVVLLWSNGWIKIPVSFRIWIPKEKCETYHTKVELAMDMINFAHNFGLLAEYISFDTWYSSKAIFALLKNCNYRFCCMIKSNRKVIYKPQIGIKFTVATISMLYNKKQYRYYPATGFYIKALSVILPDIGEVKLAIVKNGYNAELQGTRFIITDMLETNAQDIVKKYLCRWDIEVFFRDIKQHLNFEKFQVRSLPQIEGFISITMISFIFVQILQIQNNLNTIGETIGFLQEFVQVKVDNLIYIINLSSETDKCKEVNTASNSIATTIWEKLSA